MDEIKKQLNNISLYDVKAAVRRAQNVVYNYTEAEARVREATNNEPWGASSTLMQQVAAATYNYREREETVGMLFRRFTEKGASEWRQIYKALALLEYLAKNGSERFVDDARANIGLVTMLRSFHYIDSQGRDQGINVRTKAKRVAELLNNDSQLRAERRKARENAKRFQGVAGGAASVSASGGYGDDNDNDNDNDATYDSRIFGDGGVFGERYEEQRATGGDQFEEYDEQETSNIKKTSNKTAPANSAPVDLFDLDENATAAAASTTNKDDFGDDFGDFQSAVQPASSSHQTTSSKLNSNTLAGLYQQQPQQQQQQQQPQQQSQHSDFGEFTSFTSAPPQTSSYQAPYQSNSPAPAIAAAQPPVHDAFSSLFHAATASTHVAPKTQPSNAPKASTTTPAANDELNLLDL